jgi:hypothetical protein
MAVEVVRGAQHGPDGGGGGAEKKTSVGGGDGGGGCGGFAIHWCDSDVRADVDLMAWTWWWRL